VFCAEDVAIGATGAQLSILATIELIQIMNHLFSVEEYSRESFCSQNPFDGALVFEVVDVTDFLSSLAAGGGVAIMVGLD
jgi:hypothetical protein